MTVAIDNNRQKFFDSLQSSVDVSIQIGSVFGGWKDLKTSKNHDTFNDIQIDLLLSDKNELENDKIPQKDEYPTEIFFLIHLKQKTYRVFVKTENEEEFKQGFKTIFSYYENFLEAKKEDELETKKAKIAENTEKFNSEFKVKKPFTGSANSFFANHPHDTKRRPPFNEYQEKVVSAEKFGEDGVGFNSDQLKIVAQRLGKTTKAPSVSAPQSHQQSTVIDTTATLSAGVSHSAPATTTIASATQTTPSLAARGVEAESQKPRTSTKATGATSFLTRMFASIFGNDAKENKTQKGDKSNSGRL